MSVKSNQLEIPFTLADKNKLDSVTAGANPTPPTASKAEAEAGTDNVKMMTPLRTAQAIAELAGEGGGGGSSSYFSSEYTAGAVDLEEMVIVSQNAAGALEIANPRDEESVINLIGLLLDATVAANTGIVALDGLIPNITTALEIGDELWLDLDGNLTTDVPDIGENGFEEGDFVVRIGIITRNEEGPFLKDFRLTLEVIGQL